MFHKNQNSIIKGHPWQKLLLWQIIKAELENNNCLKYWLLDCLTISYLPICWKTTSTLNLPDSLKELGKKVSVMNSNIQTNLSKYVKIDNKK